MTQILVIEDDQMLRNNLAETLELEGYHVLQAENGREGVEIALHLLPDLIICDVMMPEMDGFNVLINLRGQSTTKGIPFIFLTAAADRASIRYAMNSGADDYLVKPYTTLELLTSLVARLDKRAALEGLHQQSLEELRSNLVRMLPHELRTPLIGILGYGELLRLDYAHLSGDDLRLMGEVITSEGQRLQHLIENYFLYVQTDMASHSAVSRETLVQGQAEIPGTLIRETASAKAAKLQRGNDLFVQAEDVVIDLPEQSLWKIVDELVDNAFKFSNPGAAIEIRGGSSGRVYRLEIRDHGRGMMAEQLKHVGAFMQFERTVYEQQGLGLGLILAKRLVELCNGRLTIVSERDLGTTVTVELPLAH